MTSEQHASAVRRLASKGWVIPGWITPRQLFALSEMENEEVDAFFTEAYSSENFKKLKRDIEALASRPSMSTWATLLREIGVSIAER